MSAVICITKSDLAHRFSLDAAPPKASQGGLTVTKAGTCQSHSKHVAEKLGSSCFPSLELALHDTFELPL